MLSHLLTLSPGQWPFNALRLLFPTMLLLLIIFLKMLEDEKGTRLPLHL